MTLRVLILQLIHIKVKLVLCNFKWNKMDLFDITTLGSATRNNLSAPHAIRSKLTECPRAKKIDQKLHAVLDHDDITPCVSDAQDAHPSMDASSSEADSIISTAITRHGIQPNPVLFNNNPSGNGDKVINGDFVELALCETDEDARNMDTPRLTEGMHFADTTLALLHVQAYALSKKKSVRVQRRSGGDSRITCPSGTKGGTCPFFVQLYKRSGGT
ncbi:hypothetical protein PI124_g21405 [Phytophthora idaei]|nr:hypothetical protein PI125_g2161 [Phytophthora idaei]KAG3130835.1 hypothetical protein PI126_g20323 [Phytophthora idaei]KAG3233522.1 hypothetical protein PI124_g21405 [Phytophthora idaei]